MHITILGRGPLAEPLAELARRAGHTVRRVQDGATAADAGDAPDVIILAGSSTATGTILTSVAPSVSRDVIIVDASIPTQRDDDGSSAEPAGSGRAWIAATLPRARVVRAFASVPAEALVAVLDRSSPDQTANLAVPIAGDDREAKKVVGKFMREIGIEPFDLGALTNAAILDPGGALWGKALSQVEMLETVGWLSGDG
jgi:predicted dinucleotide-binding enzyme